MPKKEIKQLVAKLNRHTPDCAVYKKGSGHYKIKCPDGSLYYTGSTPSDYRVWRKLKHQLVKRGFPPEIVCFETQTDEDFYSFAPDPLTRVEWEDYLRDEDEDGARIREARQELDELLPKKGALIRLEPNNKGRKFQNPRWKGTPPFLVLGWWRITDTELPVEGDYLYVEGFIDGETKYALACEWLFIPTALNK